MLYLLARPIARFVLRYYYRHIDLSGMHHIPLDGPVIFAANHPTAFIEPCLLACFQPRTLYFLARGDFFRKPLFDFLLRRLHLLPVFRKKDGGYAKLKNNYSTFEACYNRLERGGAILILAEGSCIHEKRLRPLRKGTARIALGALSEVDGLSEVPIVPVGIYFSHAEWVRGQVFMEFGAPISASEYLDTFRQQPNQGVNELTGRLRQSLAGLVPQIPQASLDGLGEAMLELDRSEHREELRYGVSHQGQSIARIRQLLGRLEAVGDGVVAADSSGLPQVQASQVCSQSEHVIYRYMNRLRQLRLSDSAFAGVYSRAARMGPWAWLQAVLAIPVVLFWLPLWWLAELVSGSLIRAVEFYSPVRFAVLAVGTLLYSLLIWIVGLLLLSFAGPPIVDSLMMILWWLVAVLTVNWAIRSWERVGHWYADRRARRLTPVERQQVTELRQAALRAANLTPKQVPVAS